MNNQNNNNNNQTSNNDLFSLYGGSSVNTTNNPENSNTNINLANMNNNSHNVIPTPNINSANPTNLQQPIENRQEIGSSINQSNSDTVSSTNSNESNQVGNTNSNNQQEVDKMIGVNFNNPSSHNVPMPSYQPKQNIDYDALLVSYVGVNYNKISKRPFSFSGFFFNFLYLYYRKMYFYGFLVSILFGILSNIDINMIWILYLAISLILAFVVNPLYRSFAKRKVRKIVRRNPNLTMQELTTLCSSKGGRSIGAIILGIILQFIIGIVAALILIFTGISSTFENLFSDFLPPKYEDIGYDGIILFDANVNMNEIFNIEMPFGLTDQNEGTTMANSITFTYGTDPNSLFSDCSFSLLPVSNYHNAASLAYELNERKSIDTINKNGIKWYKAGDDYLSYYLTEKEGVVYMYHFEVTEPNSLSVCKSYSTSILDSISFK